MTALSSNFFLPFERQEVARRESIKGEGGRKEIQEQGKRCTAIEERQEGWKTECGANEYTEKKRKAGLKWYYGKEKGKKIVKKKKMKE